MGFERFLVVDDNEANLLFFEVLLGEMEASQIYTAEDGPSALRMVREHRIQFIITAWEMDPMPGTVFAQKVTSERATKYLPVLIYSKRMSEEEVQLTQELGLKNILGMPFDKEGARNLINDIMTTEENISPAERRLRKIDAYLEDNKPGEALKLFDDILSRKPEFKHRAKASLGEAWIQMGKLEKAEKALLEAIEANDDYPRARQLLAKVYSLRGNHDKAIESLRELSEKSPKNLSSLSTLGHAYIDADRHAEAKEVFGKIKDLDDESEEVNDGEAKIAFKEGDINLAAQLIQETKNGEELARFFNNMAISHVIKEEFDQGIETYENAIRVLGDKAKLHLLKYNLGLAYRKKDQLTEAFNLLVESFLLDRTFEKAYAALAKLVKELKSKGESYDLEKIKQVKKARAIAKAEAEAEAESKDQGEDTGADEQAS